MPVPLPDAGRVLVRLGASLISVGTEKAAADFAGKNLLQKARARPDLVNQVFDKARREGVLSALEGVRSRLDQPLALGYSAAGTVVGTGAGVTRVRVGDRVVCGGGGFAVHAEIVSVPETLVALIPRATRPSGEVTLEEASFATVGAIALHALRIAEPQVGETVAVIGLGLIGLLVAQAANAAGCSVIGFEPAADRRDLATRLGYVALGDEKQLEDRVLEVSAGRGVDVVIVAAATSDSGPIALAARIARDRGAVVALGAVGLDIPRPDFYSKELRFHVSRSYGPGRYDPFYEELAIDYPPAYVRWTEGRNIEAFAQLIAGGAVNVAPLISHRFPIEDAVQAHDLITGKRDERFLGVVLTFAGDAALERRVELTRTSRPPVLDAVGVGMLGAGNFATSVLLPALKKIRGAVPTGIATATGASSEHAGRRFGFRFAATDLAEVVKDPDTDAVIVATRHHLHAGQVLAAIEGGKHVYCEKPLCLSADELAQIAAAAEGSPDVLVTVGYNRRFSELSANLKRFVCRAGEPMTINYRVNAGEIPSDHWIHDPAQGGGRIVGESCHFIDYLLFLTDAMPVRVFASGAKNTARYRDDNVAITIELSDGSVGMVTYTAAGDRSFSKERIEVFSGGRVGVLDDFRTLELSSGGKRSRSRKLLRQDKGHEASLRCFADVIRAGGEHVPFQHVVQGTLATFAARDSLHTGDPIDVRGEIR